MKAGILVVLGLLFVFCGCVQSPVKTDAPSDDRAPAGANKFDCAGTENGGRRINVVVRLVPQNVNGRAKLGVSMEHDGKSYANYVADLVVPKYPDRIGNPKMLTFRFENPANFNYQAEFVISNEEYASGIRNFQMTEGNYTHYGPGSVFSYRCVLAR